MAMSKKEYNKQRYYDLCIEDSKTYTKSYVQELIDSYTSILLKNNLLQNDGQRPKYCRRIKWLAELATIYQESQNLFEEDDGITLK